MTPLKPLFALILATTLVAGCASTTGIYNNSKKSTSPYVFLYKGSEADGFKSIKRALITCGFIIANDDEAAGYVVTEPKPLNEDERFDLSGGWLMGMRVQQQRAIVKVLADSTSRSVTYSVSAVGMVDIEHQRNLFNKDEYKSDQISLPQGHPLEMKLKRTILSDSLFVDVTPPDSLSQ